MTQVCPLVPRLQLAAPAATPPADFPASHSPAQVWRTQWGCAVAQGFRHGDSRWMAWPQLAVYRFRFPEQSTITAYPDLHAPTDVVWDTYRRSVLPMAMQAGGWEALHASAIVVSGAVIAFCAASGTGKSTFAYGLRRRGFAQWADDGVVVGGQEAVQAVPLPFEVRLRQDSPRLLGGSLPRHTRFTTNGPGDQTFDRPLPVSAIYVLRRDDSLSDAAPLRIARMQPSEAFTAALTHAHEFDRTDAVRRAAMVRTYLRIVDEIPMYDLAFKPSPERIEDLFDAAIETLGLQAPAGCAST